MEEAGSTLFNQIVIIFIEDYDNQFPTILHNIPKINHGRSRIDTIQSNRNNFRTPYKDIKPATPQVTHTASGTNNNTRLNDYDNQFPTILHNIPKINHGRSGIDTIQSNRNNFRTPYKDIKPATPQVTHTASGTNNNTRLNDYDNQFPTILHNIPKINHGRSGIDTIQSNRNNFRTPYKDIKPATPQVTHTASGINNNTRLKDYDNQFPTILHNIPKINHGRSGIDTIQSNRNNFRTPYKDIKPATPQVTHTASGINNNSRLKDYDQFPTILHNIPKINHGTTVNRSFRSNHDTISGLSNGIKPVNTKVSPTLSGINNDTIFTAYGNQFPTVLHNRSEINYGRTEIHSLRSNRCNERPKISDGRRETKTLRPDRDEAEVIPALSGINKFSPTTKQSARSNTLNVSYRSRRRKKRRRQAPSTTPRKINNAELTKKTRDRLISAASELQHQPNEITFLIVEIKKVINPFLYAHYRLKVEQAGEDAEEMFLYHGTSRANLDRIIDDNFDWRCTNRGKYGRGVYFANNPWFASHYSEEDDEGTMVMIAARVIIGRYHLGMLERDTMQSD
ncbi:uncharacterized protein LOC143201044 [Rhynchophorus ferrugineus]|uniref:uncharacterized protein LOC143201044 n=1 Tax=Rhynchophorus ferrugineus TaxID=354439 RepID=UPI003FCEACD4